MAVTSDCRSPAPPHRLSPSRVEGGRKRGDGWRLRGRRRRRSHPRHDGDGTMNAAMAVPGNTASTYLIHLFGTGLADERFVVEKFRALANGEIRPVATEAAAKGRRAAKRTGRLAQGGRGDTPGPHRDHHLHRAQHPRRPAGLGQHSPGPVLRPQAEGLNRPSPGRPAGPATPAAGRTPRIASGAGSRSGGRPPSRFRNRQGERPWPTPIPKFASSATASGFAGAPKHASPPGSAPGVEQNRIMSRHVV